MSQGLINEELNERLNQIVKKMFEMNRFWDGAMSPLAINFVLSNFEATYHKPVAHFFPAAADLISELQKSYNNITTYYMTPEGKKDYISIYEFFELNVEKHLEAQKLISETIDWARMGIDEDMTGTNEVIASALQRFARLIGLFTSQAILLRDKCYAYGSSSLEVQLFDRDCDKFLIVGNLELPSLLG